MSMIYFSISIYSTKFIIKLSLLDLKALQNNKCITLSIWSLIYLNKNQFLKYREKIMK